MVDVAVAQPSLPVPNDNSRRPHITVSSAEAQSQSHPPPRDRFPYLYPHDVAVIQQQHQVDKPVTLHRHFRFLLNVFYSQIELYRRQQQIQEYNERKEREFMDRERDRERERDEAQRRMDADRMDAQRNFDRERLEQARLPYGQPVWRSAPGGRIQDESIPFTAQCLINAIITENIARPPEPRDRFVSNLMRQSMSTNGSNSRMDSSLWFQGNRDPIGRLQAENNGNSHSPNIINVDVDSTDLSRHSQSSALPQKNIKLNDITDAVISKDPSFGMHHHPPGAYLPPGQHFVRYSNAGSMPSKAPPTQSHAPSGQQQQQHQPQLMGQEQIIATDQWKLNRRMQQQQHKEEMAKSGNNGGPQGRSTPDDRHIIRMAQSPSPRTKQSYEPVSPPDSGPHYYLQPKPMITINANEQRKLPPGAPSQEKPPAGDANMVLNFVHHRIAEAMRNNDEKYGSNVSNEQHHGGDPGMKAFERSRCGGSMPGNGLPENDNDKALVGKQREPPSVYISQSTRPSPQPNQAFQQTSMAFMYPYSALTIPSAGGNPIISPKAANELIDANRQSSAPPQHMETRQVLSEQYDALSDED